MTTSPASDSPYAAAMPPLWPDDFNALVEDIQKRGLLVPVVVDEIGRVIDGHQRTNACAVLGITPHTTVLDLTGKTDAERLDIAVAINLYRRHLAPLDRVRAVARLTAAGLTNATISASTGVTERQVRRDRRKAEKAGLIPEGDTGGQMSSPVSDTAIAAAVESGKTQREIAAEAGISQPAVHRAMKRTKKGTMPKPKPAVAPVTDPAITAFLNFLRTGEAPRHAARLKNVDERLHQFFAKNLIDCNH